VGLCGRLEREVELLSRWRRRQRGLLRQLVVESQGVGREPMHAEHPLDPPMANCEGVARLDDPCEFMGSEGVGECQADHVLLDVGRHTHLAR
jgi:hypothetical protein